MNNVRSLLQEKGFEVVTMSRGATVYQALELMARKDIGAVVIMEGDKLVGVFSERDYARKVTLQGRAAETATVGELMSTHIATVGLDESIENCMTLMTQRHHRHLPVIENGKLRGLVSIGDVVKAVISAKEFTIRELERYITGGHTSETD